MGKTEPPSSRGSALDSRDGGVPVAPPALDTDTEVNLGHVVGVFGLRGEVRLFLHNRESDLLRTPRRVQLQQAGKPRRAATLQTRPGAGRRIIGRIEGVNTPEAAEALMGAEIIFPKAELPVLEEDTYYHHQLLGLPVRTVSGQLLGHVQEIMDTAEVDVWVVLSPDGEEIYVPAIEEEIVSVTVGVEIVVID